MPDLTPLAKGYNIVINQKVGGVNTPIYPFTKTANVKNAEGKTVDQIISELLTVPDYSSEVASSLRFLRNDNTWADIQAASTTQAGVVQLSSATDSDSETVAATAKAVKTVMDAVNSLDTTIGDGFVKKTQLGSATTAEATGVATLDEQGKVPAAQLPSYVDDVVECTVAEDKASAQTVGDSPAPITPETGKIYVDVTTNKTYRWSGTQYVEISESLALGETAATAFAGDKGKVAYDHSQAAHARVDATKTEASEQNGYIKIDETETLVYTHPAYTTKAEGLYKVTVDATGHVSNTTDVTKEDITALGIPAQDTTYNEATTEDAGLMSAADKTKLNNCMQMSVGSDAPAFDGIWFQVVSQDA